MKEHLDLVVALNQRWGFFAPGATDEERAEGCRKVAATFNARQIDGLRWGLKEKGGQPGVYSPDILCTETPYEAVDISDGNQGNAPCWHSVTNGWPNGRFTYVAPHDWLAGPEPPQEPQEPPLDVEGIAKTLAAMQQAQAKLSASLDALTGELLKRVEALEKKPGPAAVDWELRSVPTTKVGLSLRHDHTAQIWQPKGK